MSLYFWVLSLAWITLSPFCLSVCQHLTLTVYCVLSENSSYRLLLVLKECYWTCRSKVDWLVICGCIYSSILCIFKRQLFQKSVIKHRLRTLLPSDQVVCVFLGPVGGEVVWLCNNIVPWSLADFAACEEERAASASCWPDLAEEEMHFLLLCVWVSRSVTSGSTVNFLTKSYLAELQYIGVGGGERTLVTSAWTESFLCCICQQTL